MRFHLRKRNTTKVQIFKSLNIYFPYRQFLRRNRSSESTSSCSEFTCPRKWMSDECLPDQKTRGRSNTMPSRYNQKTSSRIGSSENLKILLKNEGTFDGITEQKTHASKRESSIWNCTGDHNRSSHSALDSNNTETKKVLPIIKQSSTQKCSPKGGKGFPHSKSKGLETIRKALSRSVGSGIKTAFSRVFRKPPLGLRSGRGAKTASRAKSQLLAEGSKDKVLKDMESKEQKCIIKSTKSCEDLEHLTSIKDESHRRWCSAEALTNKTKNWVRMQQGLTGCIENNHDEIDCSSDCDSLFSADSLSSAYVIALAEQLQQEEPSEAESEDSQMSEDSLVMGNSGKHITARTALKPSYTLSQSFLPLSSPQSIIATEKANQSKEMPAEIFWSQHFNVKPGRQNEPQGVKEASPISELVFESRPSSDASVQEPENLYALTDAWSSTDAADSPRSHRVSEGLLKRALHKPDKSSSSQRPDSLDRSGTMIESECQRSSHSDSTEHQNEKRSLTFSQLETNLDSSWGVADSTPCSTHESTLLHESNGLLSNCITQCIREEPFITENMASSLYASTDTHQNDTCTNRQVPPKSLALEADGTDVICAYSEESDVMPGFSECFPDKSHMDMQSTTANQTVFDKEHTISSGCERFLTELSFDCAKQEHLTPSKRETQCGEFFFLNASELSSGPSRKMNSTSKHNGQHAFQELSHCNSALQTVLKHTNIQPSQEDHSVIQSLEVDQQLSCESQIRTEAKHQEKAVSDGKNIQDQKVCDLSQEISVTRDTEDRTLNTNIKLETTEVADLSNHCYVEPDHEVLNAPYNCSGIRSEDSPHLPPDNLKVSRRWCVGSLVLNVLAAAENESGIKLDSTSIIDPVNLSPVKKDVSACSSTVFEQDSGAPSVKRNHNRNNSALSDGPAFTDHKHDITIQEVKHETAPVQVAERGTFDDRKFQKIGLAINEKISEVVKEHLSMSLNRDMEDIKGGPQTNSLRSPATRSDDVNIHEVTLESSQKEIFPCVTESLTDNSSEVNRASLQGNYFVKNSSTEKEILLDVPEISFSSTCPCQSVQDCTVDCITLPTDSQLDSLNTGCQNGLKVVMERSTPSQLSEISACSQCLKVTQDSEYVTCSNTAKSGKGDQCMLCKADPAFISNDCDCATHTSICVWSEDCEVSLPSLLPLVGSTFSETSGIPKESIEVVGPVEEHIASEMRKEVPNIKSMDISKGDLTAKFQQVMEVSTESKNQCNIKNESSFKTDLCHKASESFETTDSRQLNKLAHQESAPLERNGHHHFISTQDQLHSEQTTTASSNIINGNDRDNKPVALKNNTCSGEVKEDIAVCKPGPVLINSCTLSKSQSNDQAYTKQRVTINGTTCNTLQTEDKSVCEDDRKVQQTKIQGPSRNNQGEDTLKLTRHPQVQASSIHKDNVVLAKGESQMEVRETNKPGLNISAVSENTRTLNLNLKEYHKHKTEPKATGRGDQIRIPGASLSSSNDDQQRVKPKKYRRAHFSAPLSSSTDSTPDSSFDEIPKTRVHHCSTATRTKPGTTVFGRTNVVAQNRAGSLSPDVKHAPLSSLASPKPVKSKLGEKVTLRAGTGAEEAIRGSTDIVLKKSGPRLGQHHLTQEIFRIQDSLVKDDEAVDETRSNSSKHTSYENKPEKSQTLENSPTSNREPVLHFTSSDINPFIHRRKGEESLKAVHKNQAFGSAVNISSQLSQLESCDKCITRCCSVDNGLNVQNSPFNSHLSTYAIKRGLSSTLSSVEDSKEHISTKSQLKEVCQTSFVSSHQTLAASSGDSCNDTSDLGHSSSQVDEIVLVYSSEHETQESGCLSSRTCNHGTQTVTLDEDMKKKSRHRRSSTQVHVSKQAPGISTTWTSLQNMSEHLSELILNTSDLLGNIQCMRTGDRVVKNEPPLKNCSDGSKVHSAEHCRRDGSTQTAVDIGVQTEALPKSQSRQNTRAHEVNVIVRVIGSDACSDSKQGGVKCFRDRYENTQSFETIKSMPDLHPECSPSAQLDRKLEVLAPKVLSLETVVPNQNYPKPKPLTANTVDHTHRQSSNCAGVCVHSICTSDILAGENQTLPKTLKPKSCPDKQVLFMDRASSPILTVDVSSCSMKGKAKSSQRLSNHKTIIIHDPTKKQVLSTLKNPSKRMSTETKASHPRGDFCTNQNEKVCKATSISSVSHENFCDIDWTRDGYDGYSTESMSLSDRCTQYEEKKLLNVVHKRGVSQPILCSPPSPRQYSSVKHRKLEGSSQKIFQSSTPVKQSYSSVVEYIHRDAQDSVKCWSDLRKNNLQYQEEDLLSLAPSECNTDVLVSINPLTETSPPKEDQWVPEDLPVHNKFTNWSGINQHPPARLSNECNPTTNKTKQLQSAESRHKPEVLEGSNRKTREIERLRKEREQVLASVHLNQSPQHLSVELTEAKLNYGLGETDTLLKMLQSSPREEHAISTKQQLYDRCVFFAEILQNVKTSLKSPEFTNSSKTDYVRFFYSLYNAQFKMQKCFVSEI